MKSAREEKTSVMEKRGLKGNLRNEKESENEEEIKENVNPLTENKISENKTEQMDLTSTNVKKDHSKNKIKKKKKDEKREVNENLVPNKKKTIKKEDDYKTGEEKMTTRSNKQKQMKITDTLKLSSKASNGKLNMKQEKKSDLIIPLKLENDNSSNSTTTIAKVPVDCEDKSKKPITKKIDFFTLDITDLEYSNQTKVYFNFKDNADKNKDLSKVNVILAIYEIALNQNIYGLQNYSNKTISFWNNVKNQPFFGSFFSYFTAETIRKYWRELSSIKSIETMITVLNDKRKEIDTNDIKLLPLIKLLKEYINNNSTGFEEFLLGIDKKKNSKHRKEDDDIQHLKKKRNRNVEESKEEEIDPNEVYKILDGSVSVERKNISLDDKFDAIAEIIESFQNCFNYTFNNEFILDALKMNSMDIQRTYEFLCDPNANKDLIFNEYEDNIILNLKSTKLYQGLIESKGEKAVKEREEFLKNEI